ncbi:PREDICTED: uncharacterized protein LOC109590615 [Amphimedon queenslandica]|nr:PREDICTED: uncharacterized protein LOC109590615 [Amphimedon queenslandica]|eukprot:XP_019862071.1 PREDICTED: uncharacterized protein LOC109590615 [Amphimedon queenslandica]
MLRTDIYLKDKAIADLAKEKSQLLVEKSQLLEEIRKLKDKLNENDFKTQLKKTNSKIYSNEEKIFTEGQDAMAMAHSADYGGELHMPSDSERGYEALPKGIDRYELAIPQQEMTKTPLTIMVLGMTGAGKSTLINSMLGRKAVIAPDDLFPGTHDTIKEHTGSVYGTPVVFYDTRGLGDPFLNDKELMKKFKQKIVQCAGDRFTILICLRFVDRLDESVKYFRDFLAKLFKNDDAIWKSCILVLTQVNKFDTYDYESDEEDEGEENRSYISPEEVLKLKMNIRIKKSAMQFQSNLERYNVPEEIIMNMPVCVAGNKRHIKLPVTDNWIKTLMDCCHMRALNFQSAHRMKGQSQDMGMYYLSRAIGGTGGDVAPIVGIPIGVTIGSLVAYKMINSLYWRRIRDGEEKEFYDSKKIDELTKKLK